MADGYTANLPVEEASDPGFFARVLPSLSGVVELVELVVPDRPTGETLIGAAIADLSRGGSFRERWRSEEPTSELQSLMRISYAVFCLKKKKEIEAQHLHIDTSRH